MRDVKDASGNFETPLSTLGQILEDRGETFEVLAVGGGALQLLGVITRPTRDVDIVALVQDGRLVRVDDLPAAWQAAVADTAALLGMPSTWFNAGPRALFDFGLPDGVLDRA